MRDADSGDCVACPKGTYSDTADAASCTSCPEGETTLYDRANDASLCYSKIYIFKYNHLYLSFQTLEINGKHVLF